jgi:hypothetical protein
MLTDAQRAQLGSSGFRIGAAPLDEMEKAARTKRSTHPHINHNQTRPPAHQQEHQPHPTLPLKGRGFQAPARRLLQERVGRR